METLTIAEICHRYKLSRFTLYRYRRDDPAFPRACRVPKRPFRFITSEVDLFFTCKEDCSDGLQY